MEEIDISSNWTRGDDDRLRNLIKFVQPDSNTCDIESVTPETCVCLEKRSDDNSESKPELILKTKNYIKEIKICSEGSLIEVFGVHDEYLFTCVPDFVDDWEGLAVYCAKIILHGINTCKLKFTRIKEKSRLWIYSVQLSVTKAEEPFNNLLFNFENINKLINNSSQEVSGKADKFKKFLELYVKNSKNQPFSVQSLLNVINRECNTQLSDCKRVLAECLSSSSLLCNESSNNKKNSVEVNGNELSLECQYLKGYIDRKFMEMKEDIMKSVEIKLEELRIENNTKLEDITKLLESSNTES